jgi:hypothetical protein
MHRDPTAARCAHDDLAAAVGEWTLDVLLVRPDVKRSDNPESVEERGVRGFSHRRDRPLRFPRFGSIQVSSGT